MPSLARIAFSAVAPPRCACCSRAIRAPELLCGDCEDELCPARYQGAPSPPGIDLALAAVAYTGRGRELVHALKFRRCLGLAPMAAELLLRACPEEELRGTVVPVPAAPWRRRWRGFDPAEEIALALAARAGLASSACLRRGSGPRQVGRPRRLRLSDPPAVRTREPVAHEVLLVDDVQTTGATLAACAAALRAAGTGRVVALTLARSP